MGLNPSKLEKSLLENFPEQERYFGLENFGNTCYCNSVLQALYFHEPFRKCILAYYDASVLVNSPDSTVLGPPSQANGSSAIANAVNLTATSTYTTTSIVVPLTKADGALATDAPANMIDRPLIARPPMEHNLLNSLCSLFNEIATQKKKTGAIAPRRFVTKLREENELFRGFMHQDAHEFFNYLLNTCAEILQTQQKKEKEREKLAKEDGTAESNGNSDASDSANSDKRIKVGPVSYYPSTMGGTFVHDIFEGRLTNETKCLCCETVTSKDECFLDLSVDVEQNTSITACLASFFSTETLSRTEKFFCDQCCSLQEAQKRMRMKKLPNTLVVHLKRFKYMEQYGCNKKLSYRVAFPFELKIWATTEDCEDDDRIYDLWAIVVHLGQGPNHGHYVSAVKSHNCWLLFDDDNIKMIERGKIESFFGSSNESSSNMTCGYVLFYKSRRYEGAL